MDSGRFLDMKTYEVLEILKSVPYLNKSQWEQTRFIGHIIAQVNSSKTIDPTDLKPFIWDEAKQEEEITESDIERLEAKAEKIIKKKWQT